MKDADLLDLLEILGDLNKSIARITYTDKGFAATEITGRKIDSFRSAIRQRMIHSQENV